MQPSEDRGPGKIVQDAGQRRRQFNRGTDSLRVQEIMKNSDCACIILTLSGGAGTHYSFTFSFSEKAVKMVGAKGRRFF